LAFRRECLEEIGCNVEIVAKLGIVTEYRKQFSLKQISYCYVAKVAGEKGTPAFDAGEQENGFEGTWLEYDKAEAALKNSDVRSYEGGSYIVPRDRFILNAAVEHIKQS
jgi:ADP-ribose pyrophosphatase YjhB (NUDIX family)